jgi:peroxiredoxin
VFDPIEPSDDDAQTGIAVGAKVPAFSAMDQNGKAWDFESLKGPKGLVLLFHRSADW